MAWNDGYVTEIDYTAGYYRELSPAHQSMALISKGYRPVSTPEPAYLELGFGQGLSLNIHAAACRGSFWGTDFNPAQAASAQELATQAGTGAKLFDQSFAEFAGRTDLPDFDMISLHGIYSWISPENRASIVEVIRKRLKPGGVVYISYNCMPGWAAAAPMSHLFRLHARFAGNQASPVTKRVEDAFSFTQTMNESGAMYFRANPQLKARLEKIVGMDKTYLAHEYLNEHWHPMHFDELASEMEPAKLTFAASAALLDHVDFLNITEKGREILGGVTNWVMRESLRDYLVNQQFRRDLWMRGARLLSATDRVVAMRAQRVVATRKLDPAKLPEIKGALGEAKPDEKTYVPIVEALAAAQKSMSIAEVEAKVAPKGVGAAQVHQAIVLLCGSGAVAAAQDEAMVQAVSKKSAALNKALCRAATGQQAVHLASPVTGGGVHVPALNVPMVRAVLAGRSKAEDIGGDLAQSVAALGRSFVKDGKTLASPEENKAEAIAQARAFVETHLPTYRRLGIV